MTEYLSTISDSDMNDFDEYFNEYDTFLNDYSNFSFTLQSPIYSLNTSYDLNKVSVDDEWYGLNSFEDMSPKSVGYITTKPLFDQAITIYLSVINSTTSITQKYKFDPTRSYVYNTTEICSSGCGFEEYKDRCENVFKGTYVDEEGCGCYQYLFRLTAYYNYTSSNFSVFELNYSCSVNKPRRIDYYVRYVNEPHQRIKNFITENNVRWVARDSKDKTFEIIFYSLSLVVLVCCLILLIIEKCVISRTTKIHRSVVSEEELSTHHKNVGAESISDNEYDDNVRSESQSSSISSEYSESEESLENKDNTQNNNQNVEIIGETPIPQNESTIIGDMEIVGGDDDSKQQKSNEFSEDTSTSSTSSYSSSEDV